MSLIDKAYFMLEEIEERWRLPHRDVVYLAENGLLKLSVRLFHVHLEWGRFEEMADGDWARVPTDQRWFGGLQDLREHDAFRLFRDGEVAVDQFAAPHPAYCHLLEPTESITLRNTDVVVRREERDAVEQRHGLDGMLNIDAIAQIYWQIHRQPRSAWTQEVDLRPFKEPF